MATDLTETHCMPCERNLDCDRSVEGHSEAHGDLTSVGERGMTATEVKRERNGNQYDQQGKQTGS